MKRLGLLRFVLLIVVVLFVIKLTSGFYVDYSWFKDLGYAQLYIVPILVKLEIGVITFLILFTLIMSACLIGYRVLMQAEKYERQYRNPFLHVVDKIIDVNQKGVAITYQKTFLITISLISFIFSLLAAIAATQNGWMKLLEFRNASSFNLKDLIFNQDVAFYVFRMPLYNFVLNTLTLSVTVIFLVSVFVYVVSGLVRITGNILKKDGLHIPPSIRKFWAVLTAIIFLLMALKSYISIFSVMYSQNGYVYGAGYTDIHVVIPVAKALAVLGFICSLASIIFFFVDDHRLILRSFGLYLIIAVLGGLAQNLVQYNVTNNEYVMEKPYIEQEIKYTQMAYNLINTKVKNYPGASTLSMKNIQDNQSTIANIRLNDPKPLKTVLSQNQGIRYYYRFNDIDVDRYLVDGEYRQVLLAPREISGEALTDKAGTFLNLTMRYTHGYGVSATLANEIDNSGYAKLIVKDIPPQFSVEGIKINEPRIYFGELTNDEKYGYIIGNNTYKEFDYPMGDENVENNYQGSTGLKLTGLNKLFLSSYFNTFRFFLTGGIQDESKLIMRRDIQERVQTLMPYLSYDQDPYLVIADNGKLYWIIDAYTTTDKFPYSAPYGEINYIRNSVKVVVDAYNGTVNFYTFDPKDPILNTIKNIFPGVFQDKKAMPSNLLEHIRYPEDLFNIQARVLLNFHVTNPSVFYNKEDTWDIAKTIEGTNPMPKEPYYSIMKLPGETKSEFTLMLPFTPASRGENTRNNMVAWLTARNDGEHYGELQLYRMPKNIEIQGPLMIESLIDQDPGISGKMTLWGQGGSEVIRGNLLVVPIDDGFLYVEPIYIKANKQGASIPQMQAIVFAIDKKIVMVETNSLEKAIEVFFSKTGLNEPSQGTTTPGTTPGHLNKKQLILEKIDLLKQQLIELEKEINNLQ